MFNQTILIGRLGNPPEIQSFDTYTVARMRVCTWRNQKDPTSESGWKQVSQWHNVVVWNANAERVRNYQQGDMVHVVGESRLREYEKADGTKGYSTDVVGVVKRISQGKHNPKGADIVEDTGIMPDESFAVAGASYYPGEIKDGFDDLPY